MNDTPLTLLECQMLIEQHGGWMYAEVDRLQLGGGKRRGWIGLAAPTAIEFYFDHDVMYAVYGVRRRDL